MLRRYIQHLLAPTTDQGGGGAAVADEVPPDAMASWMHDLPPLETPNKPSTEKSNGTPATEQSGNAPASQPAGSTKPADAGAAAAAKPEGDKGAAAAAAKPEGAAAAAAKTADSNKETPAGSKTGEEEPRWPRSNKDWEKLKTTQKEEREKLQSQIAERETQIQTLSTRLKELETQVTTTPEKNPATEAEIKRLTGLVDEMSNQIRALDVTKEPRFQAHFKRLTEKQFGLAKEILGEERAKKFEELATIPSHPALAAWKEEQMETFISELSPVQAARIGAVQNALVEIEQSRAEEIAKNQEHVQRLQGESAEKQKQAQANREKLFNDVLGGLGDDKVGVAIYQKKKDDEAWNRGVDARVTDAKRILFGAKDLKPQDIVKAALHAAAYPAILEAYSADKAEWESKIATLEAQVKELTAAQPGVKGNTGASAVPGEASRRAPGPEKGQTPQEAMAAWAGSLPSLTE